jgi:hypothetical protein
MDPVVVYVARCIQNGSESLGLNGIILSIEVFVDFINVVMNWLVSYAKGIS